MRETANFREKVAHLLELNGGKMVDSDAGWSRTLGIKRSTFLEIFGSYDRRGKHLSVYEVARIL